VGRIDWGEGAIEDLHAIDDTSVIAQILDLAETELQSFDVDNAIERRSSVNPSMMVRRAVRRADIAIYEQFDLDDTDEFETQACDYCIVYRKMTAAERITYQRARMHFLVVRIVRNDEAFRLFMQ
jgi:hypothetical protein